ncbi:MAG: hypothetical protein M3Y68_05295, partial [Chloroflexota bacterium]|nr:hypothetical protein [Chloroflexota bacterium]
PRAGLIGAGFVSSAMMLLLGISATAALRKHLNIRLADVYHLKILFAATLSGVISYVLASGFTIPPLYNIAVSFAFSTVCFITLLFLTGIEPNDKVLISNFLKTRGWKEKDQN